MIAPAFALITLLFLYPISRGIQMSFYDVKLLSPGGESFVGLANYRSLLRRSDFWQSLRVTAIYAVGVVSFSYALGLVTALQLHQRLRGRAVFRTLMIVPWAVPEVVVVLIFTWMFDAQYGVVNFFLIRLGVIQKQLGWLVMPNLAMWAVLAVTIWKQFPVATVILLAGLQTIPDELFEAASIDGANAWHRFRYVTWPGLRAVNIILVLILTLYSFRRVTIIYTMTAGGPARATETLSVQTYLQGFKFFDMSYAATVGSVLLLLLFVFTLLYFWVISRGERA